MKITNKNRLHDEGDVRAFLRSIESTSPAKTKKGLCERFLMKFETDEGAIVTQNVLVYLAKNNLLSKMFIAAVGCVPDEADTDDLLDVEFVITVAHDPSSGFIHANVVDVKPLAVELVEENDNEVTNDSE